MGVTIMLAAAGTSLEAFCNGAILGAMVFLASRGIRTPVKTRKK